MTPRMWLSAGELVALALWVVGTWIVGYLVAPVLFATIPERALAGQVAGVLFSRMAAIGIGCAIVLLAMMAYAPRGAVPWRRSVYAWSVLLMLACTIFNLAVAQPQIAALKAAGWPRTTSDGANLFAIWHAVSASVYLLQSLLGLAALLTWGRTRGAVRSACA